MEDNKDMSWLMDKVVYELYNNGVEFKTKEFGNGYFIFDFGENSVCSFTVKGLRKWRWGIWCTEYDDGEYKVSLFGEHEYFVDKFKPTQTAIAYTASYTGDESVSKLAKDFARRLRRIARHPLREEYSIYGEDRYARKHECFGFLKYHLSNFWFYGVREPVSELIGVKFTRLWLKAVGAAYRLRWSRKGNKFHVNTHDRGGGWYPRFEFQVVYDGMSDDEVFDTYCRMRKDATNRYGMKYEKPWLFTERVYHNTRFIDAESDDDFRGFVIVP